MPSGMVVPKEAWERTHGGRMTRAFLCIACLAAADLDSADGCGIETCS